MKQVNAYRIKKNLKWGLKSETEKFNMKWNMHKFQNIEYKKLRNNKKNDFAYDSSS